VSYLHNHRWKLIRRFKREFGDPCHPGKWYPKFREYIKQIVREQLGQSITLEEIMKLKKG
jgi:hypothetical protein